MTRRPDRWVAAAALLLGAAAACAHIEAPPGGPEDKDAPQLVATRPDTSARLTSYQGPAIFVFSEGLSEQGLDTLVTVSPRTGSVDVDNDGDELRVELRRGWQPGRIYQVNVAPGVRDRFGNATTQPIRLVFSTGPEIPTTAATGTVVDRTTNQPIRGARIEAALRPDSLVYTARTDSAGRWVLEQVPAGTYALTAYTDQNRSGALEDFEARDTGSVTIAGADTARAGRLAVILPDTSAPVAGSARGEGTFVEVRFDDFLDPAQPLSPSQVRVTGPDGQAVAVTEVRVGPFPDAPRADSAGARPGRDAAPARDTTPAARDSAAAAGPQEPVPARSLFARTASELAPETEYRVAVTGVRNLLGLVGGGEPPAFRTPRPAPPRPTAAPDSAAAAADTVGARPPAGQAQPPVPAPAPTPAPAPPPPAPAQPPVAMLPARAWR